MGVFDNLKMPNLGEAMQKLDAFIRAANEKIDAQTASIRTLAEVVSKQHAAMRDMLVIINRLDPMNDGRSNPTEADASNAGMDDPGTVGSGSLPAPPAIDGLTTVQPVAIGTSGLGDGGGAGVDGAGARDAA